jgi:hypothetical protein
MNGPLDQGIGETALHGTPLERRKAAPTLASFARALRQRGLLSRVDSLPAVTEGWTDTPELWIASNATYEAHLRRVGMEQVLASLRRENGREA